jgi:hypothetical protein
MPTNGEIVEHSLRKILADSHISAVAIVVLLVWSLDWAFWALWVPLGRTTSFLFTAVAILDIPYFPRTLTFADRTMLITTISYLLSAFMNLSAAWLLSHWVYGVGPFRSLSEYRPRLVRRNHV